MLRDKSEVVRDERGSVVALDRGEEVKWCYGRCSALHTFEVSSFQSCGGRCRGFGTNSGHTDSVKKREIYSMCMCERKCRLEGGE